MLHSTKWTCKKLKSLCTKAYPTKVVIFKLEKIVEVSTKLIQAIPKQSQFISLTIEVKSSQGMLPESPMEN